LEKEKKLAFCFELFYNKKKCISKTHMKNLSFLFCILFSFTSFCTTTEGFLEDVIDDLVVAENSESVEGISATAGNGSVILIWNSKRNSQGEEAEFYRIYYGTKSVESEEAETYESQVDTIDNVPSIKIDELENNSKYYFSITAFFRDGSETPSSKEVFGTPIGNLEETIQESPVVISAEAMKKNLVRISFSEDIILPEENAELAFAISEDEAEGSILEVKWARYDVDPDTTDEIFSDVVMETLQDQEAGKSYRITVSAQITDIEGNPIESGTTDSAVFSGFNEGYTPVPEKNEQNEEEEQVEEDTPQDQPPADPVKEEEIFIVSDDEGPLHSAATEEQERYEPANENTGQDTKAPEDVTNLIATFKARLTDFLVTLSWTPSVNSDNDLDDQLVYRSEDKGKNWGSGVSLGSETTKTDIPEEPLTEITYKITTVDTSGNESVGAIRSVSLPSLPSTGGGALISLGIAFIGAGIRKWRKDK
jgi:hypothetical protein